MDATMEKSGQRRIGEENNTTKVKESSDKTKTIIHAIEMIKVLS